MKTELVIEAAGDNGVQYLTGMLGGLGQTRLNMPLPWQRAGYQQRGSAACHHHQQQQQRNQSWEMRALTLCIPNSCV